MKLGKLFFDGPAPSSAGLTQAKLVPAQKAPSSALSIVFEWPIKSREIAFVTRKVLQGGDVYWDSGLWTATTDQIAQVDSGSFLAVNPKPTLALQKLVRFAQSVWAPVATIFAEAKVDPSQLIGVWYDYPEVFYTFVARHKPPSLLTRQNFYMVLRWEAWKRRGFFMQDCVEEMEKRGFGGGKLNAANLSKGARDMGLS